MSSRPMSGLQRTPGRVAVCGSKITGPAPLKPIVRRSEMSTQPKRLLSEVLHGLMYTIGFMLLICAMPVGITMTLQSYYSFHEQMRDAVSQGVVMAGSSAVVGSVLFLLAVLITKLRRRH